MPGRIGATSGRWSKRCACSRTGRIKWSDRNGWSFPIGTAACADQGSGRTVILSCTLGLSERGDPDAILAQAKEYQAQRRAKQPYAPSAGSFFKNVNDRALAQSLPDLPAGMKAAGVVPSGFLSEACGLKGLSIGGAQVAEKHANFLVNAGGATASDLRGLACRVKAAVRKKFGVTLEEEVLYVGDWTNWSEPPINSV